MDDDNVTTSRSTCNEAVIAPTIDNDTGPLRKALSEHVPSSSLMFPHETLGRDDSNIDDNDNDHTGNGDGDSDNNVVEREVEDGDGVGTFVVVGEAVTLLDRYPPPSSCLGGGAEISSDKMEEFALPDNLDEDDMTSPTQLPR